MPIKHGSKKRSLPYNYLFAVFSAAALLLSAASTFAQAEGDGHQEMASAALQAIEQSFDLSRNRIEIELPAADPRLQIPVCSIHLEASMSRHNGQGGRVSVKVDCRDAAPWARHVAAQVRVYRDAVVTLRNMPRGAVISATDIAVREVDVSMIRGQIIESIDDALGMEVKRHTNTDAVLSLDMLSTPLMVKRGETVVVTAERAGVVIRQQGIALQDGESGKQIQIRNSRSDRVIQAIVTGPGEVKVIF
ncbi:MAG: flagellar basal body P-ring formation chaperone FlgA [Pseudohongiella sp.]|nr:flagellar basal body P-ring formation chaperone FlgA [Pseudohongiella sp.]